ncbi:putative bifunctional diguanylate cyclase/phosphodiesterase [Conexibacter woesei]|uniref:putative bifunctional diguanylate cyclase/phosphodiesterase n=1 Tax=Conexibacter woesei TaxID=191495 RepID=UPI0012DE890F|nr:EAL domain-containing protein [Conexibacter woesei]
MRTTLASSRATPPSSRLSGRSARVFNLLTGAAIALGLADLAILAGVRLASPAVGTIALPLATGAIAGGLAAIRLGASRGDRRLWVLLFAGLALSFAGGVVSAATGNHVDHTGVADILWLAAYPPWYAALIVISRHYLGGAHRSFWLDGLLIGLASATYVAALFLKDLVGLSQTTLIVTVAYPAADLALLGILFGTLLMIGRPSPQGLVLAGGLLFTLASDTLRTVALSGGHTHATGAMSCAWALGLLGLASASWARPAPGRVLPVGGWWELTSPACIASLACGILVAGHWVVLPDAAVVLAAATFACALARLVWTLREVRSLALHRREALTDDLTGLPNRRALFRELEVLTAAGESSSRHFALLQLDLDGFKELNDTLGHHAGDDLLIAVSRRLEAVCPGTLARLGGDEFAAIVPDGSDASVVAAAVGEALHTPIDIEGVGVAVNASVGIAHFPQDAHDSRELARRADVAMYDAKRLGTVVAGYTAEHDEHSLDRLALAGDLRNAFDRDELWLAFQPQVDIATGRISGAEALIRWRHPSRGEIPPGVLLPIAERTGLMPQLTLWVLERAIAQAAQWRRAGLDIRIGVNVSAIVLVDATLPDRIASTLASHALTPENLCVEVTEDAVMADTSRAIAILDRIKKSGVEISVDDFGTGQSSLEQLKNVPADELKLDRSFVLGMVDDPQDAAIVGSVVGLGRALGLRVVAEGVETPQVWQRLADLGCDVAQGFGLARPMPAAQFERWAREPSDRARLLVPDLHTSRSSWRPRARSRDRVA